MAFLFWTLCYLLPAVLAVLIKNRFRRLRDRILVMHAGVLISIILLSVAGARITWNVTAFPLAIFLTGLVCATLLLGREGILYTFSSFLQEWCLLLAGSFLASQGVLVAAVSTSLVFTLAHRLTKVELRKKLPLLFLWGIATIYLYLYLHMPLVNIALHAAVGAFLIRRGFALGTY